MDDVRHAAKERAARPKKAPVGSSFESERQREKNALVRQLDAQDGRNVHKISAAPEIPEGERVLRVAAYCRVSTDDIDQKLSIHLQIQQYMKRIKENPKFPVEDLGHFEAGVGWRQAYAGIKQLKKSPGFTVWFSTVNIISAPVPAPSTVTLMTVSGSPFSPSPVWMPWRSRGGSRM